MPHVETTGWVYLGDAATGESFLIDSVDVWKFEWQRLSAPEFVLMVYGGQNLRLYPHRIVDGDREVRFAAGEFANNGWAFCKPGVARRDQIWGASNP